ncbi:MAG: hypothetical protein HYX84_02310 [Chloroflexi bacterium]|nr:hypothetical protein [Chloroflexota bacterium]
MTIASSMKELIQDIASSRQDRIKAISNMRKDAETLSAEARGLIKNFQSSRGQARVQLRRNLTRAASLRRSDVNTLRRNARQAVSTAHSFRREEGGRLRRELIRTCANHRADMEELLNGFQNIVTDFNQSRQTAGTELRKDLTEGMAGIRAVVGGMRDTLHKARAGIREEIRQASEAWHSLANTPGANRTPTQPEGPKETAVETPEVPDLETRLLTAVGERPEGSTLAEIAASLSVAPIVLGRAAKKLIDKGKIRREDRTYFPASND